MRSIQGAAVRRAFIPGESSAASPPIGGDGSRSGFRQAAGDYLVHLKAAGKSPATIESYAASLASLGESLGARAALAALSTGELDAAVAGMSVAAGDGAPARSEATLNRHRSAYRTFFRWAYETGRISRNPAALLRLARVESPRTPAITPPETHSLLSAIRRSGDRLRLRDEALFATYALTGLRRTEALRLNASDYNADGGILRVRDTKGGRARNVPVPRILAESLEKFLGGPPRRPAGSKLFPGRVPGRGLTARQAHARFERWKGVAGIRTELTIHSFRAGFATALHRTTRDAILVSRALGHRDLRPTLRYVETDQEELPRAIERAFAGLTRHAGRPPATKSTPRNATLNAATQSFLYPRLPPDGV
ncbi:MAG: tyrosine-type recombinase/integrase [Bryobacteraceae bacterium]|jgi:integrase/recombinase XerC